MKIKTSELTQERQWRATVGMDKERFFILLDHFKKAYFQTYQEELCKRKIDVNIDYCIESEEDLLFPYKRLKPPALAGQLSAQPSRRTPMPFNRTQLRAKSC